MKKALCFAVLVLAVGLHFSCTSDIESLENILGDSSSSLGSGGSAFCRYATSCAEITADACVAFGGTVVASCPVAGSSSFAGVSSSSPFGVLSSSSISGSSSSLQSGLVPCIYATGCAEMSADACIAFGGTIVAGGTILADGTLVVGGMAVASCQVGSSSGVAPSSSSSALPSSSSVMPSSSSVATQSVTSGTFTDGRDGQTYKWVKIGTQTWMAKNLNYDPGTGTSTCFNNEPSNCVIYGRLYDWSMAKEVCPLGWHLPSKEEWNTLSSYVQNNRNCYNCDAARLKATSGWYNDGNGTDDYGFSALPGGSSASHLLNINDDGSWWSASEYNSNNGDNLVIRCNSEYASWYYGTKTLRLSVRCLQN